MALLPHETDSAAFAQTQGVGNKERISGFKFHPGTVSE